MFRRLFLDHPASVGERYTEHFGVAARFGLPPPKSFAGEGEKARDRVIPRSTNIR